MIDHVKIKVKAGDGGSGAVAFGKSKGRPYGPPLGGDGGDGGSVYLEVSGTESDLGCLGGKNFFKAEDGEKGERNEKKGKSGKDLIIKVPRGTTVTLIAGSKRRIAYGKGQIAKNVVGANHDSPASESSGKKESDLVEEGQRMLVARGGKGGMGNSKLSARLQRILKGEARFNIFQKSGPGQAGAEAEVFLELKIFADFGIIGLPNAGKSSLLAVLTNAKPKIGDYPFTTVEPNLGVMNLTNLANLTNLTKRSIILADIPGLIEGASQGKGLGLGFLKHIERVKGLIHVLAVGEIANSKLEIANTQLKLQKDYGEVAEKVWRDYNIVRKEIEEYGKEVGNGKQEIEERKKDRKDLLGKKEIVVLNKIDLLDLGLVKTISQYFSKKGVRLLAVSTVTGEGVRELKKIVGAGSSRPQMTVDDRR